MKIFNSDLQNPQKGQLIQATNSRQHANPLSSIPPNHLHPSIPIPPKQWRQKQNNSAPTLTPPRNNYKPGNANGSFNVSLMGHPHQNRNDSRSVPNTSMAGNEKHVSPFVPLQAVKQHRSKHSRQDSGGNSGNGREGNENKMGSGGNSASGTSGGANKMDSPKNSANFTSPQAKVRFPIFKITTVLQINFD